MPTPARTEDSVPDHAPTQAADEPGDEREHRAGCPQHPVQRVAVDRARRRISEREPREQRGEHARAGASRARTRARSEPSTGRARGDPRRGTGLPVPSTRSVPTRACGVRPMTLPIAGHGPVHSLACHGTRRAPQERWPSFWPNTPPRSRTLGDAAFHQSWRCPSNPGVGRCSPQRRPSGIDATAQRSAGGRTGSQRDQRTGCVGGRVLVARGAHRRESWSSS